VVATVAPLMPSAITSATAAMATALPAGAAPATTFMPTSQTVAVTVAPLMATAVPAVAAPTGVTPTPAGVATSPPPVATPSRRLVASSCSVTYAPWLLVEFDLQGQSFRRCAYPFGTASDSRLDDKDQAARHLEDFAVGSSVNVWMQNSIGHCVVGTESLSTFVEKAESERNGMMIMTIASGVSAALSLAGGLYLYYKSTWRYTELSRQLQH